MKTYYLINTVTLEDYRYDSWEAVVKGAKLFRHLAKLAGNEPPKILSALEYELTH